MSTAERPRYESKATVKSLWQAYRIYDDRLELDLHVFGTLRLPFDSIQELSVRPPLVIFDLFRGRYGLEQLLRGPKLDWADLHDHVVVERDGFWKQFRFTPDDPQAFVTAFEQARAEHRARTGES
jgi:hypothetical protein